MLKSSSLWGQSKKTDNTLIITDTLVFNGKHTFSPLDPGGPPGSPCEKKTTVWVLITVYCTL